MSQRQVNLKGGDITSMYTGAVDQITNTVASIQEKRRAKSKQAILNANKTTEEFVKAYSKQTTSTDEQLQTALNGYVRQQAELIGKAKFRAQRPGATDEDRLAYTKAESQGKANLDAIAKWSVLTEKNGEAYTKDASAAAAGTVLGSLTNEALNNSDLIEFETALLSQQTQSVQVVPGKNGGTEVIVVDANGNEFKRNIFDDVKAFDQTGGTLSEYSITEDELLTGAVYEKWNKEYFSKWGLEESIKDTVTKRSETAEGDKKVTTKTTSSKEYIDFIPYTLLNDPEKNHYKWFEETIQVNFSKNWDQLVKLNLIPEKDSEGNKFDKYLRISWNTLHNQSDEQGLKNLKAMMGGNISEIDPTGGSDFTMDDYKKLQKKQNEAAITGLANLVAFKKGGEYSEEGFEDLKISTAQKAPY